MENIEHRVSKEPRIVKIFLIGEVYKLGASFFSQDVFLRMN